MVTEEDLQYEKNLLENLSVEKIHEMFPEDVLLWIRGSAGSPNRPDAMYYGLLDYKGNVRFFEGAVPDATMFGALIAGVKAAVEMIRFPVRVHLITPTDIGLQRGFKAKGMYGGQYQEILQMLKDKSCQLSDSRADGETVRMWIMSHSDKPAAAEPKENKYKKIVYRECLGKVTELLRQHQIDPELINQINQLQPN